MGELTPEERSRLCSFEKIEHDDLLRLGELARTSLEKHWTRFPDQHRDELAGLALCQGAALHFIDGTTGVKDFDVWAFHLWVGRDRKGRDQVVTRQSAGPKTMDFGLSKFGRFERDRDMVGRRVDVLMRTIHVQKNESIPAAIQRYIRASGRPKSSPWYLNQKAAVMIDPEPGLVIWPLPPGVDLRPEWIRKARQVETVKR